MPSALEGHAMGFFSRYHKEALAFRAPSTASRSAASLPGLLACPLIHSKSVRTFTFCRSSIFARTFSTRSLFSTGFPADVFQPFFLQLMYQFVTQSIAYLLSVMMLASLLRGTISRARRIAVSSARWLVCRVPGNASDMFLHRYVKRGRVIVTTCSGPTFHHRGQSRPRPLRMPQLCRSPTSYRQYVCVACLSEKCLCLLP